jgi:5-methylcytosine-specific restriction endonuclease McrA
MRVPRRTRQRHAAGPPLPSPAKLRKSGFRIVDPAAGKAKLHEGACRACGRPLGAARLERHHLVPRSLGGDDVAIARALRADEIEQRWCSPDAFGNWSCVPDDRSPASP